MAGVGLHGSSTPPPFDLAGLASPEAEARLRRDGPNVVPRPRRAGVLRQLLGQLTHLLALLLWVAALLALLAGMPQLAVAIAVVVLVNGLFAFWQEHRADRSTEELARLLPRRCLVVRDGVRRPVDAADLVVGDLVALVAGDRVPADLSLLRAEDLRVDESLLTGESDPVTHEPSERLLSGTFVVQGEGWAEVVATGPATALAGIAALTAGASRPASPLTRQLARIVRVVAVVAVAVGLALGAVGLGLGLDATQAFLFGVGVAVALVPEGLLPTVTLSLARGARLMAGQQALVRRLDAVETLGATTFVCTDKTGTVTQNRMSVVDVVTPAGRVRVHGEGYDPTARLDGPVRAVEQVAEVAVTGARCAVTGRVVRSDDGSWRAEGDPLEAALHCLALRCGSDVVLGADAQRHPYSADRMLSSVLDRGTVSVLGAPEAVLDRCTGVPSGFRAAVEELTGEGRRVLAVARRAWSPADGVDARESDLVAIGLVAVEDPPREGVREALAECRRAHLRVAMLTGDHPRTAAAIGREIGLLGPTGLVVRGDELPEDDTALGALLDRDDGVVVARVDPADKLRIARALRGRGHVVAMTGDGVNDAPALREADVGVAMGAGGSDVAREAADLVLLDDHVQTIVAAIRLGRSTFRNVRRFLTYHLSDNVAELAPFAAWALTGGKIPLALTVLQVLALDIGTDMLPALALGAEPPSRRIMDGPPDHRILRPRVLLRAFGLLGATEAVSAMTAVLVVLGLGGWSWGEEPDPALLGLASGAAFAAISLGQLANAFACRSEQRPAWRLPPRGNPLLLWAVAAEAALLAAFLGLPALATLLGGRWPPVQGWGVAVGGALVLLVADGLVKKAAAIAVRSRAGRGGAVSSAG